MNRQTDWWKDFFTGLTLDLWRAAVSEEQTRSEAGFLETNLQTSQQATLLDVPCGNGRLSLELASRGYRLTGVDISQGFIDEARAASQQLQRNVTWECREMRDLPWNEHFDGAFCFGNSFGYLDDEGNAAFLKAVLRSLKPGARFILDAASHAENVIPHIEPRTETLIGDIHFIEENHYDHALGRLDTEYTFVRGDTTEKRFGSHRLYTYREIARMLQDAGFGECRSYSSLSGEPFQLGSRQLFFACQKRQTGMSDPPK